MNQFKKTVQFIKKVRFLYKKVEISFFDEEMNIIMQTTASLLHCNEGHAYKTSVSALLWSHFYWTFTSLGIDIGDISAFERIRVIF